jgi:DNA-binding CsgD family transcriptional regulator
MGADRDAGRVQARLRGLEGTRDELRGTRPLWGWESLTPTEYRVAALVAEGLTNRSVAERMYLSRHTVDFHLRQIFRKLDVSSRVGLARVVLDQEGALTHAGVGRGARGCGPTVDAAPAGGGDTVELAMTGAAGASQGAFLADAARVLTRAEALQRLSKRTFGSTE